MIKLRVAIIGFGFMGKTHALNILRSQTMELKAIVDNRSDLFTQLKGNIDTGEITPADFAGINIYNTIDECLANESLDLMYVCVHTLSHYELAMRSLMKGLHVFIEKPFVLKEKEGLALIAEAIKQHKKIGVGHVVRFMPAYCELHKIYKEQTLGLLKFISLSRFSGVPNWGDWTKRRESFGSSGGALFDLIIHDIDFLQYTLGRPDRVNSTYIEGQLSKHDYLNAFWQYDNSEIEVKVEGGNIFPSLFPFEASFKACFENGAVCWSSSDGLNFKIITANDLYTIPLEDANIGYQREEEYFAKCIIEDLIPEACSAESSLQTIRLCYQHIS